MKKTTTDAQAMSPPWSSGAAQARQVRTLISAYRQNQSKQQTATPILRIIRFVLGWSLVVGLPLSIVVSQSSTHLDAFRVLVISLVLIQSLTAALDIGWMLRPEDGLIVRSLPITPSAHFGSRLAVFLGRNVLTSVTAASATAITFLFRPQAGWRVATAMLLTSLIVSTTVTLITTASAIALMGPRRLRASVVAFVSSSAVVAFLWTIFWTSLAAIHRFELELALGLIVLLLVVTVSAIGPRYQFGDVDVTFQPTFLGKNPEKFVSSRWERVALLRVLRLHSRDLSTAIGVSVAVLTASVAVWSAFYGNASFRWAAVTCCLAPIQLYLALSGSYSFAAAWIFATAPIDWYRLIRFEQNFIAVVFLLPLALLFSIAQAPGNPVSSAIWEFLALASVGYLSLAAFVARRPRMFSSVRPSTVYTGSWLAFSVVGFFGPDLVVLLRLALHHDAIARAIGLCLVLAVVLLVNRGLAKKLSNIQTSSFLLRFE